MYIPITWPVATDRLVFKVYDYDAAGSDELVASMIFSIKKLVKEAGDTGTYAWLNFYGAPKDKSGKNSDLMNNNPEYASQWKGRCLVHFSAVDVKEPCMKMGPVEPEVKKGAASWLEQ